MRFNPKQIEYFDRNEKLRGNVVLLKHNLEYN